MDFKDYYAILGVSADADEKTIKKAYQQLAKKYHPDVNPGDHAAEEKFKEVAEAYQAVIDPQNRKKYDELRQNYQQWQARGGREDFDWGRWQARPEDGTYTRTMSPEEFAEMFGDSGGYGNFRGGFQGGDYSDFFSTIFGMGGAGNYRQGGRRARAQAGQDSEAEVQITLEEAYHGTTRIIQTGAKRIEAKIPKGVRTGSKVRLAGQGGNGLGGGPRGDIYLIITVLPHSLFERDGDDLRAEFPVDFYTAVLGGKAPVHTLNGDVLLKVPSPSQSGQKFRLQGKGMPKLEQPRQHGDLYAQLKIVLPEHLSEEEIAALRKLAENRR